MVLSKQKVIHEIHLYIAYTLFFSLFLFAFTCYRSLLFKEFAIGYVHYGYAFVEAMILAKLILIGEKLKLGEAF